MTNATSEQALYVGLYLPGEETPTAAALLRLERNNLQESGHLAYGLGYLERPAALALNPVHLPLQRDIFRLPSRLLRDGGALPLSFKDALPDALWLAKFPAAGDPFDVQTLEAAAIGLARRCGIEVPLPDPTDWTRRNCLSVTPFRPRRSSCPAAPTLSLGKRPARHSLCVEYRQLC